MRTLKSIALILIGGIVAVAIYHVDISGLQVVMAPLIAGVIGGLAVKDMLKSTFTGLSSIVIAILILMIKYYMASPYGLVKMLSVGIIGCLPLVIAIIMGVMGGLLIGLLLRSTYSNNNNFLFNGLR